MKINMNKLTVAALMGSIIFFNLYANAVFAQDKNRRRQGPPPEAYTACEEKSEGDTAEFESPRGDIVTGTCVQDGDCLVLRPDNPPDHRMPGGEND